MPRRAPLHGARAPRHPSRRRAGVQAASASITRRATDALDCGFWPVMRLPSTTTWSLQGAAESMTAPASRSADSTHHGVFSPVPPVRSSSSVKTVSRRPANAFDPSASVRGEEGGRAVAERGDDRAGVVRGHQHSAGRGVEGEVGHRSVPAGQHDCGVVGRVDAIDRDGRGELARDRGQVCGQIVGGLTATDHPGVEAAGVDRRGHAPGRGDRDGVAARDEVAVRGHELLGPEAGRMLRPVVHREARGSGDDHEDVAHGDSDLWGGGL